MRTIKDKTMTQYENETIINYNQAEKTASCYTTNQTLIRQLDNLLDKYNDIVVKNQNEEYKEYIFPKKWVKIRPPKILTEEQKQVIRDRLAIYRNKSKE